MAGLTGDDLAFAIQTATIERPAVADEFLYEGDVLMLVGEPGVGKSILTTQLACSLTSGIPIFDFFKTPTPRAVYYLQLEGRPEQAYERMQRMSQKIRLNSALFYWDCRRGLDLLDRIQVEALLRDIAAWGQPIGLLVIDPLYQAVFGEIARELPAKAIIRFLDAARTLFKPCAILLVHHTKKSSYTREGKKVEEDDSFFGSQWLKAYVDTSFLLTVGGGRYAGEQVMLICKKSRGGDVVKDLILHYEPETDTVTADAPFEEQSGYERVSKFLLKVKSEHRNTDFFEIMNACKMSYRQVRYIQIALLKAGKLRCDKLLGKKKIWEPV